MTEHPNYASAEAVAGLAREVEALRRGIEPMRGLAGQVEDLARVVGELAHKVMASTARRPVTAAPSWLDLPPDMQTAQNVLADLVSWLGEVYLRYGDAARSFPDCWLWHPDVVEELLALMTSWRAAYHSDTATAWNAGDWHDRYRPGTVRRIKAVAGTCSLDNHLPRADRPTGARPVVPLADALDEIGEWWAAHRDSTPPQPSEDQLDAAARVTGGRRG